MEVTTRRFHAPEEVPGFITSSANGLALEPTRREAFRASIEVACWQGISLSRIKSSEAWLISRDPPNLLCVVIPEALPLRARIGIQTMSCSRESACLANPTDPFRLLLPQGATLYMVTLVEPSLCKYSPEYSASAALHLDNQFSLTTAAGRAFRRQLCFLWSEIRCGSPVLASDAVREGLCRMLFVSLQLAANGGGSHRDAKSAPPAYLRRAVDFVMTHLSQPMSVNDIAASAGVHARTLHKGFCRHFGESVTAFIQHQRLERVQRQLLEADPQSTSVTDAAIENGFVHLSRFAAAYRCRFGEYPSETLRR